MRALTYAQRVLKVDHAGEHGAVNIFRAQIWVARWRAPDLVTELSEFLSHEQRHRALFESQHHDRSALQAPRAWRTLLDPVVGCSTEAVIWLGMKL